jgi:hypothetical protein
MLTLISDKIPFSGVVQWLQRRASASTTMKKFGCPWQRRRGNSHSATIATMTPPHQRRRSLSKRNPLGHPAPTTVAPPTRRMTTTTMTTMMGGIIMTLTRGTIMMMTTTMINAPTMPSISVVCRCGISIYCVIYHIV